MLKSHRTSVPLAPPEARYLLSGLKAKLPARPLWSPRKGFGNDESFKFHNRTSRPSVEAKNLLSVVNPNFQTYSLWPCEGRETEVGGTEVRFHSVILSLPPTAKRVPSGLNLRDPTPPAGVGMKMERGGLDVLSHKNGRWPDLATSFDQSLLK